jgi:imidazolonepropionase
MLIHNARILTLAGEQGPRRKRGLRELGVIERGFIRTEGGWIEQVELGEPARALLHDEESAIDAEGRVVMPTFVDCHTHACWAGDRFDEFEMRLAGVPYLDILKRGGGIMATVQAVREANEQALTHLLIARLDHMMRLGTGAAEVKSGYGLTPDDEIKMLRAIRAATGRSPVHVTPTFLGAHAVDRDNADFVEQTITETLPLVAQEFPGITCDAFCEEGAWTLEDCRRLFEEAQALNCPIRVHTDQFNSLGMTRLAIEMGAVSVDHLEATTPRDLETLARSETIGVMMPCTGFNLDGRYAPARALIDAGGAAALATNYNPGSAPTPSIPFTIALACRMLRMTPAEAICATTWNAACVLRLDNELGSLEPGKRAHVQILDMTDERELGYGFATPGPRTVIIDGRVVHCSSMQPQRH